MFTFNKNKEMSNYNKAPDQVMII